MRPPHQPPKPPIPPTTTAGSPRWLPALLVVMSVVVSWKWVLGSDDVWAHAAVGRWICENLQFPQHALFLWTYDGPWVAHSWLSQVALYGVLQSGVVWVSLFTVVAASLPFVVLWRVWRGRGRPGATQVLAFAVAIGCSSGRFQPRPELFSGLFYSCLLAALIDWPTGVATWRRGFVRVVALALMFVVWVNCHGVALIGAAVLAATVACEWPRQPRSRANVLLALAGLLCAAALLVNPYGFRYWEAFEAARGVTFGKIEEWKPLWAEWPNPLWVVVGTAALAASAVAAWVGNPDRRWAHLAWLILLGVVFVRARRFIWMFNLTSLAVLAANAQVLDAVRWLRPSPSQGKGGTGGLLSPGGDPPWLRQATAAVIVAVGYFVTFDRWGVLMPPVGVVPRGTADFILGQQIPGRGFNDYENSSYFQWRFAGRPTLYIDLLNAYPDQVFIDYNEVVDATPRGVDLLDEKGIGYVVVTMLRPGKSLEKLAGHLDSSPGWVKVYGDHEGHVWVRRTPEYEYLWRPVLEASGRLAPGPRAE